MKTVLQIQYIFESTRKRQRGLCAFMLAAAEGAGYECDLDSVYELLRRNPTGVKT